MIAAPAERQLPVAAPGGASAERRELELQIGLRSQPELADHGFHGAAVLPGAFYLAAARRLHRDFFHEAALDLRAVRFHSAVILADDVLTVTARVESIAPGVVAYSWYEGTREELARADAPQPCAVLEVHAAESCNRPPAQCGAEVQHWTGPEFYRRQRGNGNQYGPRFQIVSEVTVSENGAAACLDTSSAAGAPDDLPLLDAAAQLLSALALERGETFVLRSIDRLVCHRDDAGEACQAVALRKAGEQAGELVGDVDLLNAEGAPVLSFLGVCLEFIAPPEAAAAPLCVAATFTAEPLEAALQFWAQHFARKQRVEFAPYNQVFQQLLDPAGAFRRNCDGVNLLVLALEDWQQAAPAAPPLRDPAALGGHPRRTLPNGLEVAQLRSYETDYLYREIFADGAYLRHGLTLPAGATVVDIGANIGLFSLFVLSQCPTARLLAFEPSPRVFELLRANLSAYGEPGRTAVFNCGVGEAKGRAAFTFYENSSVFSSFHADATADGAAVAAVIRNALQELPGGAEEAVVQELAAGRLRGQAMDCPLTSISDVIREHGLETIDLLKIDAEKSEGAILRGIEEAHWPVIQQLVLEIHDPTGAAVRAIEQELRGRGFECAVSEETLLAQSGLFNLYATRRERGAAAGGLKQNHLSRKVEDFCTALDSFAAAHAGPLVLAITPRAAEMTAPDAAERQVLAAAARHPQIRTVASAELLARYPLAEWHDAHAAQLGHVPFTPGGYAALGTALSRAAFSCASPPVKVIALDADNTLWEGQCGEDGAEGVRLTEPFRHLQEFMLRQRDAGVLLALCSKNSLADVEAVFAQRAEFPLHLGHFAAVRVNWEAKPANLRAIAEELGLGLESLVFLDDQPVECAAVRAACPEVITLQVPADRTRIAGFLDSLWIFDHGAAATSEDGQRSEWHRRNARREQEQAAAPTLRDFLESLELRIDLSEAGEEELARVAQLTLRTNQFNLTGLRRSPAELRAFLGAGGRCRIATVSDRFGDYGLVGASLGRVQSDRLVVEAFLLSCRALGKGVEHRLLADLAQVALAAGKPLLEIHFRASERNEPARAFFDHLGAASREVEGQWVLELPASQYAQFRYAPEEAGPLPAPMSAAPDSAAVLPLASGRSRSAARLSAALQQQGEQLATIEPLLAAIDCARQSAPAGSASLLPGERGNSLESQLAGVWERVLGRARVGLDENFFDAGGTSLKAVMAVAEIRRVLRHGLPIVTLFECPTIRLLAARLQPRDGGAEEGAASAESRGRQRRLKVPKRRVA